MKTNKCKNLNLMKISNSRQYFGYLGYLRKRYDSLTPVVEFTLDLQLYEFRTCDSFVNNLRTDVLRTDIVRIEPHSCNK